MDVRFNCKILRGYARFHWYSVDRRVIEQALLPYRGICSEVVSFHLLFEPLAIRFAAIGKRQFLTADYYNWKSHREIITERIDLDSVRIKRCYVHFFFPLSYRAVASRWNIISDVNGKEASRFGILFMSGCKDLVAERLKEREAAPPTRQLRPCPDCNCSCFPSSPLLHSFADTPARSHFTLQQHAMPYSSHAAFSILLSARLQSSPTFFPAVRSIERKCVAVVETRSLRHARSCDSRCFAKPSLCSIDQG